MMSASTLPNTAALAGRVVARARHRQPLGLRTSQHARSYSQPPVQQGLAGEVDRKEESDASQRPPSRDSEPRARPGGFPTSGSSFVDAAATALIGLGAVFFGGVAYVAWYKKNVLDKIELAFARGYDPALELASNPRKQHDAENDYVHWMKHVRRREQSSLDRIIKGAEAGQYYLLLGPKGTGKGTMMLDAMQAIEAEGVAMCDAHPDLEVFRLRLGKAMNYEFNEDTQTSLFQRRDPREAGPSLDIERALNKLEKVALRYARRTGRPLVLIFNNIHFFKNDDDGRQMLLQMQQRAESWAAAGILTMVFSSDDFWPFLVMRKTASRMQVVTVSDLSFKDALRASAQMRLNAKLPTDSEDLHDAVSIVGGRLSYLAQLSKTANMREHAQHMLDVEKAWLLSLIGLIPDCDDDVMDEQKWSSCSWLLLREFVKQRRADERERAAALAAGELSSEGLDELPLPKIPYYKCRQIMTRADFLEDLDRANVIAIDTNHDVTPDSVLLLQAAQKVVEEEGFDDLLDGVRARVDEIESLHRTRELTVRFTAGKHIRRTHPSRR
ncbi:uncharacterized protein B0H18DRAFT_1121075 [Fomitopsis serialis]|uniref:uncharacterized protein n=1 Tax=Fomitopsis serialis TaxID=139415 RepID=UPI0020083B27|nr:uncharacterized protein B0H18DRAFT_1121075 [Neoantrodia serialis]KAH9922046.1 hypothetical protein B0H18DRAFT_1121075 [Neoantrodia serialis]